MFRNERLEMKVGLFIGIGLFLMFFIVFSVSENNPFQKGYEFNVVFDFVNGLTENAPVRLAGVRVGEVDSITIYYDKEVQRTRVKLGIKVNSSSRIEKDSVIRINTLGLLGEQYLEMDPGTGTEFIATGETVMGTNPVNMGEQMQNMSDFMAHASSIAKKFATGEGTIGKLIMDDTLYNDLTSIFERIDRGEGTIGKFFVDDTVYNNLADFTADIKAHPWKLLKKGKETKLESYSSKN